MTQHTNPSDRQACLDEATSWQELGDDMHRVASANVRRFLVPGDADPDWPMTHEEIVCMRHAAREFALFAYSFAGHYRRMAWELDDPAQEGTWRERSDDLGARPE